MPMVADLMETCIDDVLRAPVPAVTTTDKAGPSNAFSTLNVAGEDPLSLSGKTTENLTNIHRVNLELQ